MSNGNGDGGAVEASRDGVATLQRLALAINSVLVERQGLANRLGVAFNGDRDVFEAAGYKKALLFEDFYSAYRRGDIARRIVTAAPDETWRMAPDVWDGGEDEPDAETVTDFEAAWEMLAADYDIGEDAETPLSIWHSLALVDRLSGIGRYGVLYLGLADGKQPSEAVDAGALAGPGDLLYMQAFDEGGAQVAQVDGDNTSRRFGLPLYYNLVVPTGEVGGQRQMRAHWTRCIHVAEGVDNNPLLGTPRLEACWNRLVDILKIMAGAGEAAWKLLDAGHILTTQEGKRLPTSETALADLEDQIEEFVHGLRRWLLTEGLEATQIGGSISDPTGLVMANVALISAATGIPQRILLGSERGELASSQDEDNWAKQIETRQRLHAEAMIVRPFIQRLIWAGVLPKPDTGAVTVAWQKLRKEDKQRAAGVADTVAAALQKAKITVDPVEFVRVYLPDLNETAVTPVTVDGAERAEGAPEQEVSPNWGVPFWQWQVAGESKHRRYP